MPIIARATMVLVASFGIAAAQNADREAGQALFFSYCSQCHGFDATGVGPMAELLSIATPDLTTLSVNNGGVFPTEAVAMKIDGRSSVLAHGGDMQGVELAKDRSDRCEESGVTRELLESVSE